MQSVLRRDSEETHVQRFKTVIRVPAGLVFTLYPALENRFQVQVERSYDCVERCERRDVKNEADLTFEVSSYMNEKLGMNLEPDVIKEASAPTAANVSVDTALMGIFNVFGASVTASFLSACPAIHLIPALHHTTHCMLKSAPRQRLVAACSSLVGLKCRITCLSSACIPLVSATPLCPRNLKSKF